MLARAPDDGLRLDMADSSGNFERDQRARRHVPFAGAKAAAQIDFRNGQPEIVLQIRGDGRKISGELQPRVAPLANHGGTGLGLRGLERQFAALETASGHAIERHGRVDPHEGLRGRNAQFHGIAPAPHLLCLQNVLQCAAGTLRAEPAQRLNRFQPCVAGNPVACREAKQQGNALRLTAHSHFVNRQRADEHVERIVRRNQKFRPVLRGRGRNLTHDAVVGCSRPLRQSHRQNLLHKVRREHAQQSNCFHRLRCRGGLQSPLE